MEFSLHPAHIIRRTRKLNPSICPYNRVQKLHSRVLLASGMKHLGRKSVCRKKEVPRKDVRMLKKEELKELLDLLGLDSSGKSDELRNRLLEFYEQKENEKQGESEKQEGSIQGSSTKGVTSSEGQGSKGSRKKKKWRVTDPAEIAPNFYHEELFMANFPLVTVRKRCDPRVPFPVTDKFGRLSLNAKETKFARRAWSQRLVDVSFNCKRPCNEKQALLQHVALLEGITDFARPPPEIQDTVREIRKRKWGVISDEGAEGPQDEDGEDFTGFLMEIAVEDVEGALGGSGSSADEGSDEEVADMEEHEDSSTGFADAVLYVHDQRPVLRAAKRRRTEHIERSSDLNLKTERAVAVLASKFSEDKSKDDAVYQGGYYCVKHSLINLQHGHGTPCYVIVMTSHSWTYGILVPEGYIQLRDGDIDEKSMTLFQEHQEMTGIRANNLDSLRKQLSESTTFYQRNYRDKPGAKYKDGLQLVGTLYVREQWFDLPRNVHGAFQTPGASLLFDGLMRVVLGDTVLKMKAEDFEERAKLRRQMKMGMLDDLWA